MGKIFREYYTHLEQTDIYFLMNEKKNGVEGYIGASAVAEITYVVILNLLHHKNIDIYILNMPSRDVPAWEESKVWLELGWIQVFDERKLGQS